MKEFTKFLTMISTEFHRYLMEHEELAAGIPQNGMIIFRVQGEERFNTWHKETSLRNRDADQPVTYVSVQQWRIRSLLEGVRLEKMAA